MSTQAEILDSKNVKPNQMALSQVDRFATEKALLESVVSSKQEEKSIHADEFNLSESIAESIKSAIEASGLSRESVVDRINGYLGRSKQGAKRDIPTCRNPLTINTFNNYLSKPSQCPIPAYYLFPIQRITRSLAPAQTLALPEGGHIVSGNDMVQMIFGRLESSINEAKMLQEKIMTGGAVWLN